MSFAPTVPATGDAFLDRVDEMARLDRVLLAVEAGRPRWAALVGPRKIGKSSLLAEWQRRVGAGRAAWVSLDLFREPPGPDFLRRWTGRVLDAFLAPEVGASVEGALLDAARWRSLLLASPTFQALAVGTQSWLLGVPGSHPTADWTRPALELPELLAQQSGRPGIVVIDEFQELLGSRALPGDGDVAPRLRGTWQHHVHVTYVISGSAQHTLEQLVSQRRSAFFDHFDLMRVGPLPPAEATELLARVAGRPVSPDAAAGALAVVGGHPFCLHALGDALLAGNGEIALHEVKSALQALLFSSDGRLALHYEQAYREVARSSASAAVALERLARGPARLADLGRELGVASGAIATTLSRLGEAVTKRPDGQYTLADPVLATWLAWRAPGGSTVPMRALGDEGERRAAEALAARGFELVYQSRGSRGAFDLLAIRHGRTLGVQVKRGRGRLRRAERERLLADAVKLRVAAIIAVVTPDEVVTFHEAHSNEEIANLPRWFDAL